MPNLPSPTDVVTSTLLWLGVPMLVLLPIVVALWIADWVRAMIKIGTTAQDWSQRGAAAWARASSVRIVRIVTCVLVQGSLVAFVYSGFRLAYAMTISDSSGRNIADGKSFTWSELWMDLTTYSTSAQLPSDAFWFTIGWLAALNIAYLTGARILVTIVKLPVWPIVILSAFAAVGIGVVGLMVLSLATWMHSPGYNIEMVALYAFWVVLLAGVIIFLPSSTSRAEQAFGRT